MANKSPWIHQLNPERIQTTLSGDIDTDIAVIGAGIAGVATAFFLLKYTDKKVVIVEGGKLAHGATGHNAGQLTSYFERPLSELVEEFGFDLALSGQKDVESAWELIDEMYTDAGLDIPLARFLGHAGIVEMDRILLHLEENALRKKAGLHPEEFWIAKQAPFLHEIPKKYDDLYSIVPHQQILDRLEVVDTRYVASMSTQKGCMNSALFCQEIVAYLLSRYKNRFSLYEHTFVKKVILKKEDHVLLSTLHGTVLAKKVILCTNGFENFSIEGLHGEDIDRNFHYSVYGLVGFMAAYLKDYDKPPIALSYISLPDTTIDNPYFYVTRRQFETHSSQPKNLISIGGGHVLYLEDKTVYEKSMPFPEEARKQIDEFVMNTFEYKRKRPIDYHFEWHGLMGYTKNGVRLIGEDPENNTLLYNLGCNGVGLLPSIFGARRVARIIKGEVVLPSMFDPIHMSKSDLT